MLGHGFRCLYVQLGQHMWRGPMDTFDGKVRGDERLGFSAIKVFAYAVRVTCGGMISTGLSPRSRNAGFVRRWRRTTLGHTGMNT